MNKAKISFNAIASKITGLSTPVFGVSWNPPPDKREIVRDLINFLEDRRALYNPFDIEIEYQVKDSVIKIREEITQLLKRRHGDKELSEKLKATQRACRKFLDTVGEKRRINVPYRHEGMEFFEALGQLRSKVGIYVAVLSVAYGIDIDPELASIFPD
jgi:hypothetical protein